MTTGIEIFKLPDLGEGLPNAEIREWHVAEGDSVRVDQPLVSMETAKAVVEVPAPYAGKISQLYGKSGDVIQTGDPLVAFAVEKIADSGTVVGVIESTDILLQEAPTGIVAKNHTMGGATAAIKATPAIKMLAKKLGVELSGLVGSGPNGIVTSEDVQRAVAARPVTESSHPDAQALSGVRRSMAEQMSKSHAQVVPVTLNEDAVLANWTQSTDTTLKILQAIIAACRAEPALNAHFYGSTFQRRLLESVHIGIAVDTPKGLYVPVIHDAEKQTPAELRAKVNQFKRQAQDQTFAPADLQNATITLSNFGTIAGRYATPIVVPPTVAIVGVGKTRQSVVAQGAQAVVCPVMPISLTFDHRAITGGEAARFLAAFLTSLEAVPTEV